MDDARRASLKFLLEKAFPNTKNVMARFMARSRAWVPAVGIGHFGRQLGLRIPTSKAREPYEIVLREYEHGDTIVELKYGQGKRITDFRELAKAIAATLEQKRKMTLEESELHELVILLTGADELATLALDMLPPARKAWMPPLRTDLIFTPRNVPTVLLRLAVEHGAYFMGLPKGSVDERVDHLRNEVPVVDTRGWPTEAVRALKPEIFRDYYTGMILEGPSLHLFKELWDWERRVRLLYADPPWRTGRDFSYPDSMDLDAWDEMISATVRKSKWLLDRNANVLLHLSPEAAHRAYPIVSKHLRHQGEIVWAYRTGGAPSKKTPLAKKHDIILHHSVSDEPYFNILRERVYYEKEFFTTKKDEDGRPYADVVLRDVLEGTIRIVTEDGIREYNVKPVINVSRERVQGFHTQKPEGLLGLLLEIFTSPGDIVLDPFGGTGTTALAALKTGRRFLVIERDPWHVRIIIDRLVDAMTMSGREPCGITATTGYSGGGLVAVVSVDFERFLTDAIPLW